MTDSNPVSDLVYHPRMGQRFRGFLPVVIDVETGGFNPHRDALLEISAVILHLTPEGQLQPAQTISCHVQPFPGARLDPKSLAFNGIDPDHPFRDAQPETDALRRIFQPVRYAIKASGCRRAILVGHNAAFDLSFLNAAVNRNEIKHNPFHPFSTLDTVTLAAMAYGHTVLAQAARRAGLIWDNDQAHSALYDAQKTADVFCRVINQWTACAPASLWLQPASTPD